MNDHTHRTSFHDIYCMNYKERIVTINVSQQYVPLYHKQQQQQKNRKLMEMSIRLYNYIDTIGH